MGKLWLHPKLVAKICGIVKPQADGTFGQSKVAIKVPSIL
jgi:hypothetical protein